MRYIITKSVTTMKNVFKILWLLAFSVLLSCSGDDAPSQPQMPSEENNLLQLQNGKIVDANKNPVYLKGVAFSNWVWEDEPQNLHHNETDFIRVKSMGMNSIRFYLNYKYFEDDQNPYQYKQTGWDWLNQNISWAKEHGVYLILNMHVPQGGYQSQGNGDALWENVENQNRLAALWKEIAKRYKDEVIIAGYGPVNEPVPTVSVSQWSQLAQRLINEIRSEDKYHLIFVERAIYVKGNFVPDENQNFPIVSGNGVVYEFHGYDPYNYTHQLFDWANPNDGGKYPDENIFEIISGSWYTTTFNNPKAPEGTSGWAHFEGEKYKITDANIKFAYPTLVGAGAGGKVGFDAIEVNEYNPDGSFSKLIYASDLENSSGWSFWSENNTGSFGSNDSDGVNDLKSLYIQGTSADSNLTGWGFPFVPKQGYLYQINGWMKGESLSASSDCKLRLDFYTSTEPVLSRNKEYLKYTISKVLEWAKSKNAPLYMGEFGAGAPCFENGKGGINYVRDMVEIAKENNIHFTYHAYHEDAFGIYRGYNSLPSSGSANQPLIDLFTTLLKD